MTSPTQLSASISGSRRRRTAFALALLCALTIVAPQSAQAQTFIVLHTFTGGQDGASPQAGLMMDTVGNLYGTAVGGGTRNGTVFLLKHTKSGYLFTPLYSFKGGDDGVAPYARVIFGPDGSLYGTTAWGGSGSCDRGGFPGCGVVFRLHAPPTACKTAVCPWVESVIHTFEDQNDDVQAPYSEVTFDQAGNLYGTALFSGQYWGGVYEMTPVSGGWTESVIYSFPGGGQGPYGAEPYSGLTFDKAGNLYGTTFQGGPYQHGTVYELTPSGSAWTDNTLYSFDNGLNGGGPTGGLIFDQAGNLYGTTTGGGLHGNGTVFELTPANGGWLYSQLYGGFKFEYSGGGGPDGKLVMDGAGNVYGIAGDAGAYNCGSVFKLTPGSGGWTFTSLYDFTCSLDGLFPQGNVVIDANGNLYGTTYQGGLYN